MSGSNQELKQISTRRARLRVVIIYTVAALTCVAAWAKGRGYKTWVLHEVNPEYRQARANEFMRPYVVRTRPADPRWQLSSRPTHLSPADVDLPFNEKRSG